MHELINILSLGLLITLCAYNLCKPFFSRDKSEIWSPMTFLTLTLAYYCIIPNFEGIHSFEDISIDSHKYLFNLACFVSYCSICFGFKKFNVKADWKKWNSYFTERNSSKIAVILFLFGMACHVPFRGFSTSIAAGGEIVDFGREGLTSYFTLMISVFCTACCLLLVSKRKRGVFWIILWLTLVTYIVEGFRYRIVILFISMLVMSHLYPKPRKIKIAPIMALALIMYFGFNIMDQARTYNNGIRMDIVRGMTVEDVSKRAGETTRIYGYSILVMKNYSEHSTRLFFLPLITAISMPLPRFLFPWKPDAYYLTHTNLIATGSASVGSVYVYFVEAFMSFGWIGIVVNGVFIGWIAKKFWVNYRNNSQAIGAILALGLFNGICYLIVSRGYLAQEFSALLYFVFVPFWIASLLNKHFFKNKLHHNRH